MMGRLTCMEQSETGKKVEDTRFLHSEQGHHSSVYMSPTSSIPLRNHGDLSLPPLTPVDHRSHSHRSFSSFTEIPSLEQRAHSSFQDSNFPPASLAEVKEVRSSAVSPNLKLPPICAKSTSAPETINMPPQNTPEVPVAGPLTSPDGSKPSELPLMDMRMAYENMMVSYFMPQSVKSENTTLPDHHQTEHITPQHVQVGNPSFGSDYTPHPMPVQQFAHCYLPCEGGFIVPLNIASENNHRKFQQKAVPLNKALNHRKQASQNSRISKQPGAPMPVGQHTAMDITSSGCTILDGRTLGDYQQTVNSDRTNQILKPESDFNTCSLSNIPSNMMQTSCGDPQPTDMAGGDQAAVADMSAVLNELSMFMPSQNNVLAENVLPDANIRQSFLSTASTTTGTTTSVNTTSNYYQSKTEPAWGRFSVLPPVISSATPLGSCTNEGDNLSLMSYGSIPNNAQSGSQMGMYYTPFSPFSVNFSDNLSSALASSPRYSGRSSYSGRGSRNKRALSNSPLSAEGIDLNSIIRMSPTSLIAYINGSRSSSSCVSPGSAGDKTGCYGHLSARNSSSSPHSGSGSSGNRRSTSYTPQTNTPGMGNSRSIQSNVTSDNSNISESCSGNENSKEFLNMDDNLLVIQAMQDLESGVSNASFPFNAGFIHPSPVLPECENLQVLPQDIAAFRTEDFMPFIPAVLPPVHTHQPQQFHQTANQSLLSVGGQHNKPPPTYDQHMARKATLQKNSSSDSSQPSNSSSFESSEGDKTVAGSSSTDTETNRMYACKWLDCTAVFQDQDEFVTHIEKSHIDQKKGDDFVCYWKFCPRRLHPFNARYKLLVHMRVHSGDKPNKCTYTGCKKAFSRLENLKIHLRSHTGERPYSCTFPGCVKTFSNSSDRTKHQKTHHDTKPYVCQVVGCGKRYTDPSSLRKHVKKSHPDKKEPDRKKIRGGVEDMDPKDLNECLMVQAIKPITLCDASPPEPTDSGLGRSPRGSQPGSSSDHYPGLIYSGDRSETAQGSSSHTSPSSHHSSPPGQNDRDKLPPNNNSLRVPILPPIVQSPVQQQGFTNQNLNSKVRPSSKNSPRQRVVNASVEYGSVRSSSNLFQGTRSALDTPSNRMPGIYSTCSANASYETSTDLPLSTVLKAQSRFEGEGS